MRTCPSCSRNYTSEETACAVDGMSLIDVSLSDTVPSTDVAASSPGGIEGLGAALAGRYEVLRKIGQGGMGAVYEARHALIGKRVAVKVLLDKYLENPDVVARLLQEARLASSIGHENIVDITDFGETGDGRTFVVMEFLEGESLAALLEREGALPTARAVKIVRQAASALGAAHEKGILHRDIKPENIFITRRGERDFVKVVDFGIARAVRAPDDPTPASSPRLTQTGMVIGTPLYMSPEQASGDEELDHRIDIYALGTVLYETLTGEVPFHGPNYLSIISQIISKDPRPPSEVRPELGITPDLEAVVLRAMAKERANRYQSMAELDADLARIEEGVAPVEPLSPRRARRRAAQVAAWTLGVGAVVAAVALVVPWMVRERPRPAPPPAPAPPVLTVPMPSPPAPVVRPPPPVKVTVTSKPAGAEVWWESVSKGKTPLVMELPRSSDQIELTLKLDGYVDARARFYPDRDQEVSPTLTAEPKVARRRTPPDHKKTDTGPTSAGEIKGNPYKK